MTQPHKRISGLLICIMLIAAQTTTAQELPAQKGAFLWDTLPPIPDTIGFAGSFAGVANGVLIVAGGSNFPGGGTPWNGGTKKWYDKIFVLEKPGAAWKEAGTLPMPLGYGVSVSTDRGLMLIGGSNEGGHTEKVWLLKYLNGKIETEEMPALPFPLANQCGVMVGNTIFVAGGLARPEATVAEKVFLCFDPEKRKSTWNLLPAWPGPARMLAVAGTDGEHFFLFSGTNLADGKRIYLTDAWCYSKKKGWRQLPDLPEATVAAPSPAFHNAGRLHIFGGDTGADAAHAATLREKHPGFSSHILQYDVHRNNWSMAGSMLAIKSTDSINNPNNSIWPPVTTSLVIWNNQIVFPGGEVRPATRTPNVLVATPAITAEKK